MFTSRIALLTLLGLAALGARGWAQKPEGADALSDPEIAHVAVTANAIDVELGQLAKSRALDERVLRFAETMIADHTAVNERAAALAQRLGVTPQDNAVSRQLREDADAARSELEPLQGRPFDRAYMEREVAYHRAVLEALDETLIPSTANPELRSLLEEVRPAIAAHLKHAERIRSELGGGS